MGIKWKILVIVCLPAIGLVSDVITINDAVWEKLEDWFITDDVEAPTTQPEGPTTQALLLATPTRSSIPAPRPNCHCSSDINATPNSHSDAHAVPNSHSDAHAVPNSHPDAHAVPNSHPDAHAVPNSHSDAHAVPNSHSDAHAVPNSHSDAHAVPNSHPDAHAVPNSHPDAHAVPNSHSDAHAVPNSHSDAHAVPNSHSDGDQRLQCGRGGPRADADWSAKGIFSELLRHRCRA